jgi:hypothetical protein
MHYQIDINLGHCTRKARAEEMARGWGDAGLHPTPLDTITAGTCIQWSAHVHAVLHWECQMLQCGNCRAYPVPVEEAREDAGEEDISFRVYNYKMSKRLDGKDQRFPSPILFACTWSRVIPHNELQTCSTMQERTMCD